MNIIFRTGKPEDAEICASICYEAFKGIATQHNFPPDFADRETAVGLLTHLLSRTDIYSVVAEIDGRIVGSNFLDERKVFGGLGPITVDPTAQNRAVGRRLMEAVHDRAAEKNLPGVRLIQAGFHTRSLSLYAKLDYDVREHLACMQGPALSIAIPGYAVRPATESDLDACNRFCRQVHGHDRGGELLDAIKQGTAMVVKRNGRITGYATIIGFFGHAVAETNDDLKALIGASKEFAGPGFLLPTRNGELFRWCLTNALRVTQPMTLMSRGLYNEPVGAFLPSILY